MGYLLLAGMLIGMRHAMDADHVAAVASLVSRKQSLTTAIRQGGVWGLGHTITLLLFGSIVIFIDTVIPESVAKGLEMAVGGMLVLLGADLLRRMARDRIHFHTHRHDEGYSHFHAHSHLGEPATRHELSPHDHQHHRQRFPLRALLVGLMHGMAGSAAVILLTLDAVTSPFQGILYILIFGIGSMFGMLLLSVVISIPMQLSAGRLSRAHNIFQLVIGLTTIALGLLVLFENSVVLIPSV